MESRILENEVTIKVNETNEVWPNLWFTEMVKTRIDESLETTNVEFRAPIVQSYQRN